jgi:hypothetical protein
MGPEPDQEADLEPEQETRSYLVSDVVTLVGLVVSFVGK